MRNSRKPEAATARKNLFSGLPVWLSERLPHPKSHVLNDSVRCDVLIVGAGISGAFMAESLSRHFDNVVVVDRRHPAHGSTAASTAMLQWEIDTPLTELAERIGPAKAERAWKRSYRATQDLVALVRQERIACGLQKRSSLYLSGDSLGFRGMKAEAKARGRIGLPSEFLSAEELRSAFAIDRTGAIVSDNSAIANPMQLAGGLLARAIKRGAKVYVPVDIIDFQATNHGVSLDTGHHFIEARQVVFCTGYELLKSIPTEGTKITSSWAIATRPHAEYPRWLNSTLVWEAAEPYLYMRTTPDGRLVVGGEDEDIDLPSYRAQTIAKKSRKLEAKTKKLFPGIEMAVSKRWTGAFGESVDGLPIIDAVPGCPNCFTVMGFGGNGTIYSVIASQLMPSLLKARRGKDAEVFSFRD